MLVKHSEEKQKDLLILAKHVAYAAFYGLRSFLSVRL